MSIFPTASGEVQSDEWKYAGIGGWLILPVIGLWITPLAQIILIATNFVPLFTRGAWTVLTTPGTAAYHPMWAPLLIFELGMKFVIIAADIYLLVLLHRRSPLFPKGMILFLLATFLLLGTDYFFSLTIPYIAAQQDRQGAREFMRSGVACIIWIPYFVYSKRVKATFRPPLPAAPSPAPME